VGYDSNGNWTLTPGYLAIAGQTIQPSQHNPVLEDIGQNGLSAVLVRDGRAPMTGALNMGGFKVTNLLAGTNPLDGVNKTQLDTALAAVSDPGSLYGLTLSNNGSDPTNDIDIAIGSAASDAATPIKMTLATGLTKRLDAAWAVGTNAGGLDTGSVADGTYHVWLIQRSDTGVVDALFSTSATSPTMPTNYDRKRRIGSIIRSVAILGFTQRGDTFKLTNLQLLFSSVAFGNAALTISGAGPAGVSVEAIVNINLLSASGNTCYISDLTSSDIAPSAQVATVGGTVTNISGNGRVFTSTSRTFRARCAVGSATETLNVSLVGWVDTRGRL
jgi:hypothetical protein